MGTPIKMATRHCALCGAVMERKKFGERLEDFGRFLTRKTCGRRCMAAAMKGIKIVNAKNGRRAAAKTVAPACEACGKTPRRLHVHHIDEDPTNNDSGNLITLCPSDHKLIHSPLLTARPSSRGQVIAYLKAKAGSRC